ncbi:glycosyltransferase family 1 protein, partial [Candidatus Woesearchaeota archaeon]
PVYLKASDVLVIPEVNEFRSPIKLFEYMAAGKAIIAPRRPAIEAVISDGVESLMFKPGDPQSFGSAIIKIIENDVLAAKLGENAKKRVFRDYTWEQHSKVILDEFFDVRRGC